MMRLLLLDLRLGRSGRWNVFSRASFHSGTMFSFVERKYGAHQTRFAQTMMCACFFFSLLGIVLLRFNTLAANTFHLPFELLRLAQLFLGYTGGP